jgi:hypothetical protein
MDSKLFGGDGCCCEGSWFADEEEAVGGEGCKSLIGCFWAVFFSSSSSSFISVNGTDCSGLMGEMTN